MESAKRQSTHAQAQHAHAQAQTQAQTQQPAPQQQQAAQQQAQELQQTFQQGVNQLQTPAAHTNGAGSPGPSALATATDTNTSGVGESGGESVEFNHAITYLNKIKVSLTSHSLRHQCNAECNIGNRAASCTSPRFSQSSWRSCRLINWRANESRMCTLKSRSYSGMLLSCWRSSCNSSPRGSKRRCEWCGWDERCVTDCCSILDDLCS
jgi:hypothetical protein